MQEENFASSLVFTDEAATFQQSGKVNHHNVRIWGLNNLMCSIEYERNSPKISVFYAISKTQVCVPSFFY